MRPLIVAPKPCPRVPQELRTLLCELDLYLAQRERQARLERPELHDLRARIQRELTK